MGKVVLLVTWFVVGQPPQSYQADFATLDACNVARLSLLSERARLTDAWQQAFEVTLPDGRGVRTFDPIRGPSVIAVCAAR